MQGRFLPCHHLSGLWAQDEFHNVTQFEMRNKPIRGEPTTHGQQEGMRNVLSYLSITEWRVMLGPEWCACQWEANRLLAEWSGFKCLMVGAAAEKASCPAPGDLVVKVRPWEVAAASAKGSKLLILWEADFGCDSLPLREGGDSPSFLSSLLRISSRGSFCTVVLDIHSQLKMYTKSTVS